MAVNSGPRDRVREPGYLVRVTCLQTRAVGLVGVVFMVVAFFAPITAMTGNLPVAVRGSVTAWGRPGGFVIATIVLTVFSVGFVALAHHITAAGAFYTFVSRGWSKVAGGCQAGVMSMFTYMTMEAATRSGSFRPSPIRR